MKFEMKKDSHAEIKEIKRKLKDDYMWANLDAPEHKYFANELIKDVLSIKKKEKESFISDYMQKKMEGHGLPYGMVYLNLLAETEIKAHKAWKKNIKTKWKIKCLWQVK